ncbi:MAG: hypothetical protein LUH53_01400, partial [Lachnospiraceae bacterium]|nr:hypothetical protein [Lachnospiraceae bacterium]
MEKETVHGRSFRLLRGQYGYKARDKSPSVQRGSNEAAARKRECLLFWLLAAAICVMRLWHISDLHAPFLLDDEIGYWSHAANLAGLSWTGVESLWYSYGYSLLLVPLFWVSHNMEILYRLAIAENALLGVLGFWAGYHLILELDEDFDRTIAIFISFVAASYSAYVFQSNIAWSETFVYAWFLVTALQAVRFCKRPTCLNTILLTAATVLLYIIHNRTLAIWIALLLTLLYMLIRRRISWKYVVLAAGILVIAYMANQQMKGYLTALMLGSGGELKGNSVSSQSGKFALLTSFAGIKRLLQSLAGKCWYLLSSTLLVGYAGMVYLLKAFATGITGKQSASCEGKERTGQEGQNGQRALMWQDCAALFLILSVLGTVALATLTSVPKTIEAGGSYDRLDVLFYGHYSDMISGLLILTGLMYLYRYSHRCKSVRAVVLEMLPGVLIYGVCFAAVQAFLDNLGSYVINIPCVPGVFFLRFDNFTISFIKITAIAAALFFLIFLGFFLFRHRLAVIGVKVRCI